MLRLADGWGAGMPIYEKSVHEPMKDHQQSEGSRIASEATAPPAAKNLDPSQVPTAHDDATSVVLVGCVKSGAAQVAPARGLCTSDVFLKRFNTAACYLGRQGEENDLVAWVRELKAVHATWSPGHP